MFIALCILVYICYLESNDGELFYTAFIKDAMEMQRKGERELKEAQELKRECLNQQESLQMELSHLRKKEIQISAVCCFYLAKNK